MAWQCHVICCVACSRHNAQLNRYRLSAEAALGWCFHDFWLAFFFIVPSTSHNSNGRQLVSSGGGGKWSFFPFLSFDRQVHEKETTTTKRERREEEGSLKWSRQVHQSRRLRWGARVDMTFEKRINPLLAHPLHYVRPFVLLALHTTQRFGRSVGLISNSLWLLLQCSSQDLIICHLAPLKKRNISCFALQPAASSESTALHIIKKRDRRRIERKKKTHPSTLTFCSTSRSFLRAVLCCTFFFLKIRAAAASESINDKKKKKKKRCLKHHYATRRNGAVKPSQLRRKQETKNM